LLRASEAKPQSKDLYQHRSPVVEIIFDRAVPLIAVRFWVAPRFKRREKLLHNKLMGFSP
jgi:hypothetical protein